MNVDEGRYDVVVIGGGPAGLQAALTLGRMHRTVLLLDSGEYRNAPTDALHNFITRDGTPPAEFRLAARGELAAYATVTVCNATATWVKAEGEEDFRVELADGSRVGARRLVLATGVRDTLPAKPGLTELFGTRGCALPLLPRTRVQRQARRCAGLRGAHGDGRAAGVADRLAADHPHRRRAARPGDNGPACSLRDPGREPREVAVEAAGDGATVVFADGESTEIGGLFVATTWAQSAPFAEDLGLTMLPSGCIEVDAMGRTSLAGVYAAGDLAHTAALPMPMSSVLNAAANGQIAAASLDRDLMALDHGLVLPA